MIIFYIKISNSFNVQHYKKACLTILVCLCARVGNKNVKDCFANALEEDQEDGVVGIAVHKSLTMVLLWASLRGYPSSCWGSPRRLYRAQM